MWSTLENTCEYMLFIYLFIYSRGTVKNSVVSSLLYTRRLIAYVPAMFCMECFRLWMFDWCALEYTEINGLFVFSAIRIWLFRQNALHLSLLSSTDYCICHWSGEKKPRHSALWYLCMDRKFEDKHFFRWDYRASLNIFMEKKFIGVHRLILCSYTHVAFFNRFMYIT